jgi:purine catabolism regulator
MATMQDLLDEPSLELPVVVLPQPETSVRWVATSELADPTPFLEGGEVLLTTGLDMVSWHHEWEDYASRLSGAGVVAVGFATGLTHSAVPTALASACERHRLNLVEVPRQTTFVAVSRAVARLLEKHEQAAAREALTMQRELTQAARAQNSTAALTGRLEKIVGGRAFVLSPEGEVVHPASRAQDDEQQLRVARGELERIRPQGLRASAVTSGAGGTTVVQPIGLRGSPEAYLAVSASHRLSEGQKSAVTTAVALLSLEAASRQEQRDTLRRLRGRAVELITKGDARTAALVLAAATGQAPEDVRLPQRVRMLRAAGSGDQLAQALRSAEEGHDRSREALLLVTSDAELWVVASVERSHWWASRLAGAGLRVGVGSAAPLGSAAKSHAAAAHALAQTTDAVPVVSWDDIVDVGVLAMLDQEAGAAFADDFLDRLTQSSTSLDDLMRTLQSFLRHHGRHAPVAAELGIHRNTVRHRVTEIETAIGRSLDEPQTRVNAWVALQLSAARQVGSSPTVR